MRVQGKHWWGTKGANIAIFAIISSRVQVLESRCYSCLQNVTPAVIQKESNCLRARHFFPRIWVLFLFFSLNGAGWSLGRAFLGRAHIHIESCRPQICHRQVNLLFRTLMAKIFSHISLALSFENPNKIKFPGTQPS